jgi:predicted nucleic acid-binding protein
VGLILDSSVLITAERKARSVSELLAAIRVSTGPTEILLSAVSVIELEHGLWRANTPELAQRRRIYLDEIFAAIPVEPFTKEMGQLAAKIDAEARKQGAIIPFADLQIGATALHFQFAIGTLNVRHFEMIPNLVVKRL